VRINFVLEVNDCLLYQRCRSRTRSSRTSCTIEWISNWSCRASPTVATQAQILTCCLSYYPPTFKSL